MMKRFLQELYEVPDKSRLKIVKYNHDYGEDLEVTIIQLIDFSTEKQDLMLQQLRKKFINQQKGKLLWLSNREKSYEHFPIEFMKEKDFILKTLRENEQYRRDKRRQYCFLYRQIDRTLRRDPEIVLQYFYNYLDELFKPKQDHEKGYVRTFRKLMNDPNFVRSLLKQHGRYFQNILKFFPDSALGKNAEYFWDHMIRHDENYDSLLSEKDFLFGSMEDRRLMLSCIQHKPSIFSLLSNTLKFDKEVAMVAVKADAEIFLKLDNDLKEDRDIQLEALLSCSENSPVLSYFEIKESAKELLNIAILFHFGNEITISDILDESNWIFYYILRYGCKFTSHLSQSYKSNKHFAIRVLKRKGCLLEYFGESIRSDREIVWEAVKNSTKAFQFASDELRSDRTFVLQILDNSPDDGMYMNCLGKNLTTDIEVFWKILNSSCSVDTILEFLPEILTSQNLHSSPLCSNIFLKVIEKTKLWAKGYFFVYAPEELKADHAFILAAIEKDKIVTSFLDMPVPFISKLGSCMIFSLRLRMTNQTKQKTRLHSLQSGGDGFCRNFSESLYRFRMEEAYFGAKT